MPRFEAVSTRRSTSAGQPRRPCSFSFLTPQTPIYHWPVATVLLIVLNATAVFFVTGLIPPPATAKRPIRGSEAAAQSRSRATDPTADSRLILHFNPHSAIGMDYQRVRAGGLHAPAGEYALPMADRLVVEGKLGWHRFLATYLGIGVIFSAVTQIAMFSIGHPGDVAALRQFSSAWSP